MSIDAIRCFDFLAIGIVGHLLWLTIGQFIIYMAQERVRWAKFCHDDTVNRADWHLCRSGREPLTLDGSAPAMRDARLMSRTAASQEQGILE